MQTIRRRSIVPRLLPIVCFLAIGCSHTRVAPPTDDEYAAVRDGRAAVVMLRVVEETTAGARRPALGPSAPGGGKRLSLARLDAGGPVRTVDPVRSPADGALRRGWVYLVLKPGTHYLLVHDPVPPGHGPGFPPDTAAPGEDWLLDVPAGARLVYAGTIVFPIPAAAPDSLTPHPHKGARPAAPAWTNLATTRAATTRFPTARDESAEARLLASEHFPALTAEGNDVRTWVMRPYAPSPIPPSPGGSAAMLPPRVRTDGAPRPTGFGVHGTCVQDGAWPGLLYGDPILSTAGSSTNTVADIALLMVKAGLYFWAGAGAIAGSVVGIGEARDLQPCVDQAVKWTGEYDLAARLSDSLNKGLAPPGAAGAGLGAAVANQSGPVDKTRPLLHVTVQELHLRPCTKAHLACIEAKVRVRLRDPHAGRYELDRIYLYSNAAARHRNAPYGSPPASYVLPIDESPVLNLHALGRLSAAERRRTIETEMDRAAAALARHATNDLVPTPDTQPNGM